jgi:hypothetical protein
MVKAPETAGLQGMLLAQFIASVVFMILTFDEIVRGLMVTFGITEAEAEGFAVVFDIGVVGLAGLTYLLVDPFKRFTNFLIVVAASIGIWGTYLTVAMRGGAEFSP